MRLKALLLLPFISIIGISVVIKIFGSFILAVIFDKLKKDNHSPNKMWKCRKCAKPVYFAERKSSLGFDWHPQCLKCEECGKTLTVGQHAEHKGIPYCHIPCYGALFGPTLYGHGSRVESHTSFGKSKLNSDQIGDKMLESKLKEYNHFYEGKSFAIQYRERNGKYILEGSIRIYWDVSNVIQLKEENDDRVFVRRRISCYLPVNSSAKQLTADDEQSTTSSNLELASNQSSFSSDDLSSPSSDDFNRSYKTLPIRRSFAGDHPLHDNTKYTRKSFDDEYVQQITDSKTNAESLPNTSPDSGAVTFRRTNLRRSRVQLKRRCSINGHFYNRETSTFTPEHGSVTSVWISSLVNVPEVINMLLDKFKVKNQPNSFALFIVRDNGEVKRLQDYDCPLLVRVMLGPNEDAAKVFILNKDRNEISTEVAQYLNLSNAELQMFLRKFDEEEFREINRIKKRYTNIKRVINMKLNEFNANIQFDSNN